MVRVEMSRGHVEEQCLKIRGERWAGVTILEVEIVQRKTPNETCTCMSP